MAVNKVEANGETLIDLTDDTVTADTLLSGRTAHLASGAQVTGTFEPVTGVKGNAESAYRKGNVNLTPANIGAATSEQGAKADSAVQTIQISGTTQTKTGGTVNLPAYPTKSSLGLGNVDNTSDANKPISTAAQAEFDKQQAQIDKALEQTGYNLLEITNDTRTIGGVTFTVNRIAGTITVNGTATANVWFEPINDLEHYYPANVRLTGCPRGGSISTYYLGLADTGGAIPYRDYGNGCDIPVARIKRVTIGIVSGFTCNNLVFKPMIVPAELAGVPFQPYAMSNVDLTQMANKYFDDLRSVSDKIAHEMEEISDKTPIMVVYDYDAGTVSKSFSEVMEYIKNDIPVTICRKYAITPGNSVVREYFHISDTNTNSDSIHAFGDYIIASGTGNGSIRFYELTWDSSTTLPTFTFHQITGLTIS